MKLWRGTFGALKDQNSIWISSLSRRTALRNPKIQAAVIKATSHDELSIDADNISFLYRLLRMSSAHHRPIMFSISIRMAKTCSWIVALKGLILMHGIFACKIPSIQKEGVLPFDLSNFQDGHSRMGKAWAHNKFIRSYYAFLHRKSAYLKASYSNSFLHKVNSLEQELLLIQGLQVLLDMLLEIRPETEEIVAHPLFVEAIDCVNIEIFDVYSQICRGISKFDVRSCSVGKAEAAMALEIIQKATIQGKELCLYFEICKEIGVVKASDCPIIEKVSTENVKDLEDIVNGRKVHDDNNDTCKEISISDMDQEGLIIEKKEYSEQGNMMMTIITHNWETFDEDLSYSKEGKNPFEDLMLPALPPPQVRNQCFDLPDLISF